MATWQHLRSSTANKRPTTSLADGRIAINTNTASPGLFFKDSAGTGIVKVGPVHVGTTAPNSVPAAGGSTGNYLGEQWLDTSVSPAQMKVWNGSTWIGVVADELPVSKLQDGAARQLIQTDAAGTGVEWTSNIDVPGTLDVTSTATFDSIAQYPLGTAAAPTITFTGDNNTGIYSPGADQLAISTGGSGRLFVDSSGRVGIGQAPSFGFDLQGTGQVVQRVQSTSASGLSLGSFLVAGGNGAVTYQVDVDGTGNNFGPGALIGTTTNHFTAFRTNNTERLRITAAGLVGVGTSSPQRSLHIVSSADGYPLRLESTAQPAATIEFLGNTTVTAPYIGAFGDNFAIVAGNTTRLHVASGGNVGVGTTSPAEKLHVVGDGVRIDRVGGDPYIDFYTSGSANNVALYGGSSTGFRAFVGGSERLRIDSSGRVGIGTSTVTGYSSNIVHINGATGSEVHLTTGGTGATAGDGLSLFTRDSDGAAGLFQRENASLLFGTNDQTKVTITSGGSVGIGTTSPSEVLDVSGTAKASQFKSAGGAGATGYDFSASGSGAGVANVFCPSGFTLGFGTNSQERARIDSSGRLLVGTSSTSNNIRFLVQGSPSYSGGVVQIANSGSTPANGDDIGVIQFSDSNHTTSARILVQRDGGTWTSNTSMPTRLVFSTTADGASSPTERMRLINSGFLKVSNDGSYQSATSGNHEFTNTLDSDSLVVRSTNASYSGNGILALATRNTTNNSFYAFSYYNSGASAYRFRIADSGNATNTNNSYGAISDIKLKENIVDANSQWDDLKALQVRKYNFKEGQTHTQIGLVAQEVELVSPGLVTESPDRDAEGNDLGTVTKSVNYSVLYMKAVKALQEAMERIETLEAKVAALESA